MNGQISMVMNAPEMTVINDPIRLIPASAPFSDEQRAWLNGFFAGWLGVADGATATKSADTAVPPQQDEDFPWHDPAIPMDERMKLAEGRPLQRTLMAAMAQLDCGACGYLCQTYAEAIAGGSEPDLGRCSPGGKDTKAMLKTLMQSVTVKASDAPAYRHLEGDTNLRHDRSNPFPAPVLAIEKLNGPGSTKDTRFISVSIAGSGLSYKVGDSLGVYPRNCYEQVDALIRLLEVGGGERVSVDGRPSTFRAALIEDCDIMQPSDALYDLLASGASDSQETALLKAAMAGEAVDGLVESPRVIDVLARFRSTRPAPEQIVNALDRLRPRLYSISSSPRRYPDEVHLTIGVVHYQVAGQHRKGVASTFLAERVMPHQPVSVFIQPSHGFTLTDNHDAPVIMIGPGTGIAPFRAFLQERQAQGARGRNWLFFGDQHQATDLLYRDELEQHLRSGLLTRLSTAFSRDQEEKVYVQHRMIEHAAELWRWLDDGGCVYVCGDAKRMAVDVERALLRIIGEQGRHDEAASREYLAAMRKAGRYLKDVY